MGSNNMKWFAAAVACSMFIVDSESASAGWRHHYRHGSYGSWGSSGSSGSSGYWGGSSGGWGSSGSSGYWGSGGSSGSGGYWGGPYYGPAYMGYGPVYMGQRSVGTPNYAAATPRPAATVAPARLVMNVPENATIYCMGKKTTTTGTNRRFVIPLSTAGQEYDYPIKIEIVRDGKTISTESVAKVQSGQTVELNVTESPEGELLALVQR